MKEITLTKRHTQDVINIINNLVDEANMIHAAVKSTYMANEQITVHVAYYNASMRFLELLEELKNA